MKKFLSFIAVISLNSCIALIPFTKNEGVKESSGYTYQSYSKPLSSTIASAKTRRINPQVQLYLAQLHDKKDTVRTAAASYLGMMGPTAKEAIPALTTALNDPSKFVRRASARALGRIGNDARIALSQLKVAAKDKDPWVAHSAQNAIKKIN